MASLGSALRLLREPIPPEKKRLLAERWETLPESVRYPFQGYGRQATGCGATIGTFPKCDFDCQGCYLGEEANSVPRFSSGEIERQLAELRGYLGPKGNVQITDGEVTLLPEAELISLLRCADGLGLIPMLMTHGDSFRRKPHLLRRLVEEGGLREVSIHVDRLQRGRRNWPEATTEEDLSALRAEFAEHVRQVRRETGVRLRAATTMTVSSDNLDEIPGVVEWAFRNRDAFGLISFQPLARVGRTEEHLAGVSVDQLWSRIGRALAPYGFTVEERSPFQFGHVDCTRMEPLAVYQRPGGGPQVLQPVRPGRFEDRRMAADFLERGLGGIAFRNDTPFERLCRSIGMVAQAPGWFAGDLRRWAASRARELDTSLPRLAFDLAAGRARLDSFVVVSHHFMSEGDLDTERGRERLNACVFRLPIGGEMVPMCEVNADRLRERVYAQGTAERRPAAAKLPVVSA